MTQLLGVDCPCGFTFTTPHGEDDAVAIVQLRIDRVHAKDYPKGLSEAEAVAHLKKR